jgi:hypothetical protein
VHVLRSHLCALDFQTKPPVDCPDHDSRDAGFVKVASSIGGRDAVEEYLACGISPLSASVSFRGITDGVSPVSRVRLPLTKFHAVRKDEEDDVQFLARVKLEAESVVDSYSRPKHDACVASVLNRGRLNHVFELAAVAYGPWSVLGTEAYTEASKKRKVDAYGKTLAKRAKAPVKKKAKLLKIIVPQAKTGAK